MSRKNQVILDILPEDRIKKSKVVALMNNKGGCGKTSTSIALGMYLVRTGHNVLFWDNDPQSNLTQRLGLPDGKLPDKRINLLFKYAGTPGIDYEKRQLANVVEYPYLYRLKDTIAKPGKVGLMAGSHDAENDANAADKNLAQKTFSDVEYKDIYAFFEESVRFYSTYFDYVIMDTAPAIEGNILNKLAVRAADEIIIPIDGIEAALGMRTLMSWMHSQAKNYNGNVPPNVTFAMVKYQQDTKLNPSPTSRLRNSVFRIMKNTFGDYVCDNGVMETAKLRSLVSGIQGRMYRGGKTEYYDLCREIINKFEEPRDNIFKEINSKTFAGLELELLELYKKIQDKEPEFKNPYYKMTEAEEKKTKQKELNVSAK